MAFMGCHRAGVEQRHLLAVMSHCNSEGRNPLNLWNSWLVGKEAGVLRERPGFLLRRAGEGLSNKSEAQRCDHIFTLSSEVGQIKHTYINITCFHPIQPVLQDISPWSATRTSNSCMPQFQL